MPIYSIYTTEHWIWRQQQRKLPKPLRIYRELHFHLHRINGTLCSIPFRPQYLFWWAKLLFLWIVPKSFITGPLHHWQRHLWSQVWIINLLWIFWAALSSFRMHPLKIIEAKMKELVTNKKTPKITKHFSFTQRTVVSTNSRQCKKTTKNKTRQNLPVPLLLMCNIGGLGFLKLVYRGVRT